MFFSLLYFKLTRGEGGAGNCCSSVSGLESGLGPESDQQSFPAPLCLPSATSTLSSVPFSHLLSCATHCYIVLGEGTVTEQGLTVSGSRKATGERSGMGGGGRGQGGYLTTTHPHDCFSCCSSGRAMNSRKSSDSTLGKL